MFFCCVFYTACTCVFRVEERNGSLQQNRHINSNEICDNMEGMFTGMTKAVLWTITSSNQSSREFDICLSVHRYYKRREESRIWVRDKGNCTHNFPHPGRTACCPAPNRRPPATKALHTICVHNKSVVSSS